MSSLTRGTITLDVWRAKLASSNDIEARQRRRFDELLSFARRQSRFYKRHYAAVPQRISSITELPPVTKSMLMEHFDDVVTDPAITKAEIDTFVADESKIGHRFLGRYPVWTTSGTTGEPGIFVQDETTWTILNVLPDRWMVSALFGRKPLTRLLKNEFRGAEIAVTGGHFAGASGVALMQRESRFLQHRIRLFSPTQPFEHLVSDLNHYQPSFLIGYSTVLLELARAKREGHLDISPALIAPTAEPVSEIQKLELALAFDCAVREIYGATECYPIAVECERGNLHANTDWVVIEPVDEEYQPVSLGEPSETVLITNLANRVQPIVRYDLGDSITMYGEQCSCGSSFPVIEVEGRQGDVLRFHTAGEDVMVFPLALSSVTEEVPGVRRSQIVRTSPEALRVHLEFEQDVDQERVWKQAKRDVRAFLTTQGITEVSLERGPEPPRRNPASGKFRHVWSEVR